uniref:Uncharacterized protein n=1 Tax=Ananas comosus var. bracteatus TaxID=296719 RepID=A0A6V7NEZ6_ANACO|nr:unnamed protein product [Ananas comosus var. bracteatus]
MPVVFSIDANVWCPVENEEDAIRVYGEVELVRGDTVTKAVRCWSAPCPNIDQSEEDATQRYLDYTCLPFMLFAHACEGRSLQAGTPELAYATYVRSCGIEKPTGSSGTDTFQE